MGLVAVVPVCAFCCHGDERKGMVGGRRRWHHGSGRPRPSYRRSGRQRLTTGTQKLTYECMHLILRMCSKKTAAAPSTRMDTCAQHGETACAPRRRGSRGGGAGFAGERGGRFEGGEEEAQREGGREKAGDGGERPSGSGSGSCGIEAREETERGVGWRLRGVWMWGLGVRVEGVVFSWAGSMKAHLYFLMKGNMSFFLFQSTHHSILTECSFSLFIYLDRWFNYTAKYLY